MDAALTPDVFASPAVAILCGLERDGFRVELTSDGALTIAPYSRLTPERRQAIVAWKDAMLVLLCCGDEGVAARRAMFARQLASTAAPRLPAFLFRTDVPYQAGACFSCGDQGPAGRFARCWRCSIAWRLACRLPIPANLRAVLDTAKVA